MVANLILIHDHLSARLANNRLSKVIGWGVHHLNHGCSVLCRRLHLFTRGFQLDVHFALDAVQLAKCQLGERINLVDLLNA